ncbi:MAG TPA: glutamate-cysteine ligase family protein, partial [Polyangiaceae bacterium]
MIQDAPEDTRPIQSAEDLLSVFRAAEKPPSEFRIGAEAEKFGVRADTGQPLSYDGEFSVVRLFDALKELGWQPERETPDGPVIALRRNGASITLEPGSQFELSGAALPDVHAVHAETLAHLEELAPVAAEMNLVWLGVGFHPIARQAELGWVPKQRYRIMREYLPPRGSGAHDMMRRTATVQANFDFSSEEDALRKLRTALMLAPLVNAMTANSPFVEARRAPELSHRGHVWLHMDPSRSGTIRPLLEAARPRYEDYAEWALDAGMFLFKREQRVYTNSGQTFRDFLANGFEGERATLGDWRLHLNTLF